MTDGRTDRQEGGGQCQIREEDEKSALTPRNATLLVSGVTRKTMSERWFVIFFT